MHPSNRIRNRSVFPAVLCIVFCVSTDAFAQTKPSQDRGGRGILRNFAASILNNSGRRPWIPDGRNRTVIVTSPSYVYSNESSNLVFSPGAYDALRPTQVNTPPSLAAMYHPTPATMSPVREAPVTTYMNTTTLRPIAGAGTPGSMMSYQMGAGSAPIFPSGPVRDSRGFHRREPSQSVDIAKEAGIAIGRAEVAFEQGRYDDALRAFDRARDLSGVDATLSLSLGVAAFASGQYDRASTSLQSGVQLAPHAALTYRLLARYGDPKDFRMHRNRLETHAAAHPDDVDATVVLTLVRWWDGDARGALAALDRWEAVKSAADDDTAPFRKVLRHWADRAAAADPVSPK
ncbi:Tetratricopeptide repeat protein [Phycisphaerae bacterium RAS2]|nr:Tetratricopeptide repeat protein [Phycisphaerae bacterium RAS2]